MLTHEIATGQSVVRHALKAHQEWIEKTLGVDLTDTVLFNTELPLAQAAVRQVLGRKSERSECTRVVDLVMKRVVSIETPDYFPPLVDLESDYVAHDIGDLRDARRHGANAIEWQDCPVSLNLRGMEAPIVAMNTYYHTPNTDATSAAHTVIVRRDAVAEVLDFFDSLGERDSRPRLRVFRGNVRPVGDTTWDDLVLDQRIASLLKDDFESFFKRRDWFEAHRLPFRRGYLLHGPPGNGKTSAVKAMMNSRSLDAYTLRLFDKDTDDSHLEAMFDRAAKSRPSIVLLEDIDRAFPKSGQTQCKLSLQALLNCLDGVATQEGVVVVATANEPTALDAAILKRPGRFDRVVCFPDPGAGPRESYFRKLHDAFKGADISEAVAASEGYSFAMLRESYAIAAQLSFDSGREITPASLRHGVEALSKGFSQASQRAATAGYRPIRLAEVLT